MRNALSAVGAVIDDEPEPLGSLADAELAGNFSCGKEERTQGGLVIRLGFANAGNDFLGNDENVDRGLRLNVVERSDKVVLVNEGRRDLSSDDFFEDGSFAHDSAFNGIAQGG